jgi:hypothetical protein
MSFRLDRVLSLFTTVLMYLNHINRRGLAMLIGVNA